MITEIDIDKLNVGALIKRCEHLTEEKEKTEKKIVEFLNNKFDEKFIIDIIRNRGLSEKEKMNILLEEDK